VLTEFGFGRPGSTWPLNAIYYFEYDTLRTVPTGFVDAIAAVNPSISRIRLLQLMDPLLFLFRNLDVLEVAFSFDYFAISTFSVPALLDFFEVNRLRRLVLPFLGENWSPSFWVATCQFSISVQIVVSPSLQLLDLSVLTPRTELFIVIDCGIES
jgi:hypothetical protein